LENRRNANSISTQTILLYCLILLPGNFGAIGRAILAQLGYSNSQVENNLENIQYITIFAKLWINR